MTNLENNVVRHAILAMFVAIVAIAAMAVVRADDQMAPQPPAVGTAAPDFVLNSQEGTPVHLSDFRGKWVVLYFYPKDFTSGCTLEAHNFQADIDQYTKKNAVIVGVSVDTVDSHKGFCAKEGLNFKLLSDVGPRRLGEVRLLAHGNDGGNGGDGDDGDAEYVHHQSAGRHREGIHRRPADASQRGSACCADHAAAGFVSAAAIRVRLCVRSGARRNSKRRRKLGGGPAKLRVRLPPAA